MFSFLWSQFLQVFNKLRKPRMGSQWEMLYPLLNTINVLFSKAPDLVSCSTGVGRQLKKQKEKCFFCARHYPSVKVCNRVSVRQGGTQQEHVATRYFLWMNLCEKKIARVAKHRCWAAFCFPTPPAACPQLQPSPNVAISMNHPSALHSANQSSTIQ